MKNILFVCKHNVFRSKVAEGYFKKINRNKNLVISSAGIIKPNSLDGVQRKSINLQRKIAGEFGIKIKWNPRQLSIGLLRESDIIIISADDVPKKIFRNPTYAKKNQKIIAWRIRDAPGDKSDRLIIRKSIKKIIKKMDKLVRRLG